uniref:Uncharacterized protein n=1 Tax=Globisporangium ultimum (strain ATCC 200006 / CBS 805.95 / DAOM BR144) TaxID=431595 RepID=K3X9G7_GLOUD
DYANFRYASGHYRSTSTDSNHHHQQQLNSPVAPSDDEARDSTDTWDIHQDLTDGLGLNSRLGENPPPATFWENYPKQQMSNEPIPLALQSMLQDPNRTPTAGTHHHYSNTSGNGVHDDEFSDAMFEKLATEFGGHDMHFGPI